ncbi:hypothetical protein Vafri_9200 [Volvox africanus]|uniref:Uncharacterized protein n=1 Tax=Volvox africanus TaxID=51714 RepID=A0A8J4EZH5_9CHLO|nr:hypothetical protein Vafri_9200 [Volvox africanus]
MPSLCGVVRQELRRYSEKLSRTLSSIDQRGPVKNVDQVAEILSEVHALFDDDFLDRLEPSKLWIPSLLEFLLVIKSAELVNRILQTYNRAKNAGLFSQASAVSGHHHRVKRHVWAQLAAVEIAQAAFPILWAVQAIQVEAASTPAFQCIGSRLMEHLSVGPVLQAMADATRFVKEEVWIPSSAGEDYGFSDSSPTSPNPIPTREPADEVAAAAKAAAAATGVRADMTATATAIVTITTIVPQPLSGGRSLGVLGVLHRHLERVLSDYECGSGGAGCSSGAAAAAGARVLSIVAQHLSALSAGVDNVEHRNRYQQLPSERDRTPHNGHGAMTLLDRLRDSKVLTELSAAILMAPTGSPVLTLTDTVADDYTATLADVQLTTCMAIWDLSALLAPYGGAVGELLAAPEVLQLRRTALEQVAASVPLQVMQLRGQSLNGNANSSGGGGGGGITGGGSRSAGSWIRSSRGAGGSGGGGAGCHNSRLATTACWPLLHCNAVRRVYAARGLQLADVIHILVDAAVGAIYMSQDHGAHAAILAAKQLFRSRPDAADIALRVCRALFAHASTHEPPPLPTPDRGGNSSRRSPFASGGGVGSCSRTASGGGGGIATTASGSRMSQSQRAQLADDAASVEVALQIRMLGASTEEVQACTPAVMGVRSWVQRLASAACAGPSVATVAKANTPTAAAGNAAAAAATAVLNHPGLMGLDDRSAASSGMSSLSSPDETTVYDNAHSPRYPTAGNGHGDSLASGEGSSVGQPRRSPAPAAGGGGDTIVVASPPDSNSSNSTASQAGSMSVQDLSGSGPSVTESKSKTKFKLGRVPTQCGGPGSSNRMLQVPEASVSPSHSPVRRSLSNSLRRSIDKLKRWVSFRRSHEDLSAPADAEAQIMLPVRTPTPMRHGDGSGDGSSGGGGGDAVVGGGRGAIKAWHRVTQSFVAPHRNMHSIIDNHSTKFTSPPPPLPPPPSPPPPPPPVAAPASVSALASPPPPPPLTQQQHEVQPLPRLHPATPTRAGITPATMTATTAFGTPPRLQPSRSGSLSQALAASSPGTPATAARLASAPAVDIIARIPVIHSPCQGQATERRAGGNCGVGGGGVIGNNHAVGGGGGSGIGRYLASSGRTTPEVYGMSPSRYPISIMDSISPAKALSVGLDPRAPSFCDIGATTTATATATVIATATAGNSGDADGGSGNGDGQRKPTVAPSRRSVLRSGVLAAPLRLLRRRERRVVQEVGGS